MTNATTVRHRSLSSKSAILRRNGLAAATLGLMSVVGGCASTNADSPSQSPEVATSVQSPVESSPEVSGHSCPQVLRTDSPPLDTPEGRFTLDRVELWIEPDCLGTPFEIVEWVSDGDDDTFVQSGTIPGPELPAYLIVYTWTNTTDTAEQLGYNFTPLHAFLSVDGDFSSFVPPVEMEAMIPYQTVEPGQSVTEEQWHSVWEGSEPQIPDELSVRSGKDQTDYGTMKLIAESD